MYIYSVKVFFLTHSLLKNSIHCKYIVYVVNINTIYYLFSFPHRRVSIMEEHIQCAFLNFPQRPVT